MQNMGCVHYCLSLQTFMIRKCVFKSTWFFKWAGDGSSKVLIFCLLYAFKYSENKILSPSIPKWLLFYNFRFGIIQRKPNILQTSATVHPLVGCIFYNEGVQSLQIARNLLDSTNGKMILCLIFWFGGWMEVKLLSILRRREIGSFSCIVVNWRESSLCTQSWKHICSLNERWD